MKSKKLQQGFTLVEIIIVFALIALISTYMLGTGYVQSKKRARDTQRRTHVKQIAVVLEEFINDHGQYPASSVDGKIIGCGANYDLVCDWGDEFGNAAETLYMAKLPQDVYADGGRTYIYRSNGLAWQLYVTLEDEKNKDVDRNGDGDYVPADDGYDFVDCGPGYCNYGVSSGNVTVDTNPLP